MARNRFRTLTKKERECLWWYYVWSNRNYLEEIRKTRGSECVPREFAHPRIFGMTVNEIIDYAEKTMFRKGTDVLTLLPLLSQGKIDEAQYYDHIIQSQITRYPDLYLKGTVAYNRHIRLYEYYWNTESNIWTRNENV